MSPGDSANKPINSIKSILGLSVTLIEWVIESLFMQTCQAQWTREKKRERVIVRSYNSEYSESVSREVISNCKPDLSGIAILGWGSALERIIRGDASCFWDNVRARLIAKKLRRWVYWYSKSPHAVCLWCNLLCINICSQRWLWHRVDSASGI